MNITLVIPRLGWGGAARSMLDIATAQLTNAPAPYSFTLIVLGDAAEQLQAEVRAAGIRLITGTQTDDARRALTEADLVHVNFWNTPEMYAWLRAPQPPMRLVMTLHIAGDSPAQMLTAPVLDFADWLAPTSAYSYKLALLQNRRADRTRVILPGTHMPASDIMPPPHTDVRIGYAGTVDFVKLHPHFIALCAAVQNPRAAFPVAGGGDGFRTLQAQAQALGVAHRFEWLGYRTDIVNVLASFDLLGYPLAPRSYATGDLILQQAMWLGVPPIIFDYGALPLLVRDGETGILARDENAYVGALESLSANESERQHLSQNARAYARLHFGADKSAVQFNALYDDAMQAPKRERSWGGNPPHPRFPGAGALVESFGASAEPYITMLNVPEAAATVQAEYEIAHASPMVTNAGGGGILDYRRAFPHDPLLRFWTGLVLGQQSRYALAAAEFYAAKNAGLENPRLDIYLAQMMNHQPLFAEDANP